MSKTTEQLEAAVAEVIANRPVEGDRPTARQRAIVDRAFARVLKIVSPRIRHFIKQYGLTGHWEDAEQVCAIAVHRAIEAYDPQKAMFTTFVNWQIRGELQGLRFRLMEDQRPSARKVEATTISLHSVERGPDGEEMSLEALLIDEEAHSETEAGASAHLAQRASEVLMDEYARHLRSIGMAQLKRKTVGTRAIARTTQNENLPKFVQSRRDQLDAEELQKLEDRIMRDRQIIARHLFALPGTSLVAETDDTGKDDGLTKERIRQITRRAARVMAELASGNPRFAHALDRAASVSEQAPSASAPRADLFPQTGELHNMLIGLSAPSDPDREDGASVDYTTPVHIPAGASRLRH